MSSEDAHMSDEPAALRRLVERQAIEDALLRYGSAIDAKDFVALRGILCDDVSARYGDVVLDGADELVDWIATATADRSWQHHLLAVYHVHFLDETRAEALTYHTSHHIRSATPDRCTRTVGRYRDTVRKIGGAWRIAEKVMEVGWSGDAGAAGPPGG
jgi:SnoaL-like domain